MPDQSTPDRPPGLDALLDHVAANLSDTFTVLAEVAHERGQQDAKWGEQNHPDGTGRPGDAAFGEAYKAICKANGPAQDNWRDILAEEVAEAFAETDWLLLRAELVQIAAVAVHWIEAGDRRTAGGEQA